MIRETPEAKDLFLGLWYNTDRRPDAIVYWVKQWIACAELAGRLQEIEAAAEGERQVAEPPKAAQ